MWLTRVCGVVVLIASTLAAGAGPRILLPDEAPGAEVRAAAAEFLKHLADGDAAGTKALFVGDPAQADLLAAHLQCVASCERLRKAIEEKFGPGDGKEAWGIAAVVRQRAQDLIKKLVVVNGDRASLSPNGLFDGGMELHRTGGDWRVTHLHLQPVAVKPHAALLRKMAETSDQLVADLRGGKLTDIEAVRQAFEAGVRPMFQGLVEDPQVPPGTKAAPPAWKSKLDAAGLAGLIGKPLGSTDVGAFIDSLPGVPYVSGADKYLWVIGHEAGVELSVDLRDQGKLRVVLLHSGVTPAWGAYGGELPSGLAWSDTRRDVERKLGRPPLSSGGELSQYTAEYPRLGLRVGYATRSLRDADAPIYNLAVEAADPHGPDASRGPQVADKPRLAFRLVAPPGAAAQDVDLLNNEGDTAGPVQLAVERRVLLDERDVAGVSIAPVGRDFKQLGVSLQMTTAGAAKLKAATAGNIGRQLAIVLDGHILMAPTIRSEISSAVLISMGAGAGRRDAHTLTGRLHAAVSQSVEAK